MENLNQQAERLQEILNHDKRKGSHYPISVQADHVTQSLTINGLQRLNDEDDLLIRTFRETEGFKFYFVDCNVSNGELDGYLRIEIIKPETE